MASHQNGAIMQSGTVFRVLSAAVLLCVCARAERQDLPRDFGVKLCGREFIRAVIFTCGGSRWRRSASPPGAWPLDRDPELGPDGGVPLLETRADRRKRNFSMGLAGMCCNQGCTKHDIGRLC